ncbi:hypothetical protein PP175_10690 [Aneurinibacillus sp. Ricciae_BoGa-3]|uniref:hypothetical protein n=1 Tax=Aneurinibacillus sp. Ricciae_BoGa-3 TaxID=3022697 RepID=UPI0023424AB1|nr:hypothetical protein [Aneurinibacillus sp. Ricciae_BoGa-3]WCK56335.1 hypothetical protein PP175_10690 [Aneurinibacillus sp. Ricciae_BoGa-3]
MLFKEVKLLGTMLFILLAGCQHTTSNKQQPAGNQNTVISSSESSPNTSVTTTNQQTQAGVTNHSHSQTTKTLPPVKKQFLNIRMDKITALRLVNARSGWVAGEGWIAKTENEGKTWTVQYRQAGTIHQVFALNSTDVWATISSSYNLLHSTDGGKHWISIGKVPNHGFLHFISNNEGFSGNAETVNGGKSWTALPVPPHAVGYPYFHDKDYGWIVTQETDQIHVQRTKDGGKTWLTVMSRKTQNPINDAQVQSAGIDDAWIKLVGDSGMSQTSYSLFHTINGGKNWRTVIANSTAGGGAAPGFPMGYIEGPKNSGSKPGAMYVVDSRVTFMGGQCDSCDKPNTIGWTTDGGQTWVNGKQSFAGYGTQLIGMVDAKHGWWICTDNARPSVMYATSSGGNNWRLVHTFDQPKQTQ